MLIIDISEDNIRLKNISIESIENIYSIYKNTDGFKYATGVYDFISFEKFSSQLIKFISHDNGFFLDIHLNNDSHISCNNSIGFVKGSLAKEESILWLNTLAIDTPFQSYGYGKQVILMLEKYFMQKYNVGKMCLSVSKDNSSGVNFWKKCGFSECDFIVPEDLHKLTEHTLIMLKKL